MSEHTAYALTFISKDRPGIVADVTKVLYENGFNIADSSSTLLRGVFSMILLVEHKSNMTTQKIESLFSMKGIIISVYEIPTVQIEKPVLEDNFIISVYGADKPGIVHHIAAKLYEKNINIVDLQTQTAGEPLQDAYIMVLEVVVPSDTDREWVQSLKDAAKEIGTDITIRRLETYEL